MAVQVASSNINFTSASWNLVDSTSYLFSEAGTTTTTSAYQYSSTFTPGAITVVGILVRGYIAPASVSGTVSIQLFDNTASSQVTVVTCNMSDLGSGNQSGTIGGWYYFKFSGSQTLTAGHAYKVGVLTSANSNLTLYRDSTAANWTRGLVTSTTGSLSAGDTQIVVGTILSAGSTTTTAMTMDNTSATGWGNFDIGFNGNWVNGTAASTNYVYTQANNQQNYICLNGTMKVGDTTTRIPSTSTAVYTFASNAVASAATSAIVMRNTASLGGAGTAKTRYTRQTANFSAAATSITCASVAGFGWVSGDVIGIGATDRGASPAIETKALTGTPTTTTLAITAVTTGKTVRTMNANGDKMAAPLINLSSNVSFNGSSNTNTFAILDAGNTTTLNFDNVLFTGLGGGASPYTGIANTAAGTNTSTHSWTFNSCAFNNCGTGATASYLNFSSAQSNVAGSFTITNNVFFGSATYAAYVATTTALAIVSGSITNNWSIGAYVQVISSQYNFQNCVVNGGLGSSTVGYNSQIATYGTWSGNSFECTAATAVILSASNPSQTRIQISNFNFWFANNFGFSYGQSTNFLFSNFSLIGNLAGGFVNQSSLIDGLMDSWDFQGNATYAQPGGFQPSAGNLLFNTYFQNCTFGTFVAHSTSDVVVQNAFSSFGKNILRNCTLASTTQVSGISGLGWYDNGVYIQKSAGTAGSNRAYLGGGRTDTDSTITYNSNTYSLRLTPSSATQLMYANLPNFGVLNGQTATVTVYLRKSVAGDGAAYNGSQPYIVLRSQDNMGHANYAADQTVITADNSCNGAWVGYSFTLPNAATDSGLFSLFAVCNGTAGWVNIGAVVPS